jgi:hypothetical protein
MNTYKPTFSSDRDVPPEGEPIAPWKVGCLGTLFYKLGCVIITLAFLTVIALLIRFGLITHHH